MTDPPHTEAWVWNSVNSTREIQFHQKKDKWPEILSGFCQGDGSGKLVEKRAQIRRGAVTDYILHRQFEGRVFCVPCMTLTCGGEHTCTATRPNPSIFCCEASYICLRPTWLPFHPLSSSLCSAFVLPQRSVESLHWLSTALTTKQTKYLDLDTTSKDQISLLEMTILPQFCASDHVRELALNM